MAQQQPPPEQTSSAVQQAAATAAAAYAQSLAARAAAAPAAQTTAATVQAVDAVAGGLAEALRAFLRRRSVMVQAALNATFAASELTQQERAELLAEEADRERRFAVASSRRLELAIDRVLRPYREPARTPVDPTVKPSPRPGRTRGGGPLNDEVKRLLRAALEREQRFADLRERAVRERAEASVERARVRAESPDGALWTLNPEIDNCVQCRSMAGKVWPWSVLNLYRPPLHPNCACKLIGIAEARRRGLITGATVWATWEQMPTDDLRESRGVEWIISDLELMEARWDQRYPAGSKRGGQFRPRVGAAPQAIRSARNAVRRGEMRRATPQDRARLDIPETWTEVHVSVDEGDALQAVGVDSRGKVQRRYSRAHQDAAAAAKWERVARLNGQWPEIEALIEGAARGGDDTAVALLVIARLALRPGGTPSSGAVRPSYGATTLRRRHVRVHGDEVWLTYPAKGGIGHETSIVDPLLASLMRPRVPGAPDDPVFDTSAERVRAAFAKVAPGYLIKDLRTLQATRLAAASIAAQPRPVSQEELDNLKRRVSQQVAVHLGNSAKVAADAYIAPQVWPLLTEPQALHSARGELRETSDEGVRADAVSGADAGDRGRAVCVDDDLAAASAGRAAAGDAGSAPGRGPGRADLAVVERIARSTRPSNAGVIEEGYRFDPDAKRSRTEDGVLILPAAFWRQTIAQREKVVRNHLRRLQEVQRG